MANQQAVQAPESAPEPAPPSRICGDCGREMGAREIMRMKAPKLAVCEECYTDDHSEMETIPDPLSTTNRAPSGGSPRERRRAAQQ